MSCAIVLSMLHKVVGQRGRDSTYTRRGASCRAKARMRQSLVPGASIAPACVLLLQLDNVIRCRRSSANRTCIWHMHIH